jgi:hypothetical protein
VKPPAFFRRLSVWRVLMAASLAGSAILTTVDPGGALVITPNTVAGFEIDGNEVVNTGGNLDWLTPGLGALVTVDDTTDSGFVGTSKENQPSGWVCNTGGANPSKGNILRAYRNVRVPEHILDLAWVRDNTNQGETSIEFELNQGPASGCAITRTTGDLLVSFDYPNGNGAPTVNLYRWIQGPPGEGMWDPTVPGVVAAGAVNTAAILAANDLSGLGIADNSFGEVSLDLTGLIGPNGSLPCSAFSTLNNRTRSSNAVTNAALQDRMGPVAINLCPGPQPGRIIVQKQTTPNGSPESFLFTPTGFNANAPFNLGDGQAFDSGPLTPGVGLYSVSEVPEPGWLPVPVVICSNGSPSITITVNPGETVTCVFNNIQIINPPPTGVIVVRKVTDPAGSPADFEFVTNYGSSFLLSDGETNNSGPLVAGAGTYSVAEEVTDGWDLVGSSCSDGSPINAIALSANEMVTCTFTNRQRGHVTVTKSIDPQTAEDFSFTPSAGVNGGAAFDLDVDGDATLPATRTFEVTPGVHTVVEGAETGFTLASIACNDGDSTGVVANRIATFNVAPGEDVTCVFTNRAVPPPPAPGHIIVRKVAANAGNQQFSFRTNFDGALNDGADFAIPAGGQSDSGPLAAGVYAVAETVPSGWNLASATCDDGSTTNAIGLAAGETVTCTFVNVAEEAPYGGNQPGGGGAEDPYGSNPGGTGSDPSPFVPDPGAQVAGETETRLPAPSTGDDNGGTSSDPAVAPAGPNVNSGQLPRTGSQSTRTLGIVALLLIALGSGAIELGRTRRQQSAG